MSKSMFSYKCQQNYSNNQMQSQINTMANSYDAYTNEQRHILQKYGKEQYLENLKQSLSKKTQQQFCEIRSGIQKLKKTNRCFSNDLLAFQQLNQKLFMTLQQNKQCVEKIMKTHIESNQQLYEPISRIKQQKLSDLMRENQNKTKEINDSHAKLKQYEHRNKKLQAEILQINSLWHQYTHNQQCKQKKYKMKIKQLQDALVASVNKQNNSENPEVGGIAKQAESTQSYQNSGQYFDSLSQNQKLKLQQNSQLVILQNNNKQTQVSRPNQQMVIIDSKTDEIDTQSVNQHKQTQTRKKKVLYSNQRKKKGMI